MIHTNQLSVMHVTVKAGHALPEHHHPHEQITNIIEGEFEMTVDGVTKICKAGDVVVIRGDKPHAGRALTDCRIIDVLTHQEKIIKSKFLSKSCTFEGLS